MSTDLRAPESDTEPPRHQGTKQTPDIPVRTLFVPLCLCVFVVNSYVGSGVTGDAEGMPKRLRSGRQERPRLDAWLHSEYRSAVFLLPDCE